MIMENNRYEMSERINHNRNMYTNKDYYNDEEYSKLDDLELDLYDINNLPPSLSVTLAQRNNDGLGDSVFGLEIKKTIMVGGDYQSTIPKLTGKYDEPPYTGKDKLLWNPRLLSDKQIEDFLTKSQQIYYSKESNNATSLPSHTRDDEQALYILLQSGYDVDVALKKLESDEPVNKPPLWTEEECRNFESGIRAFGKDFYLIHLHKVQNRSVGDLVKFYYLWKKTERYKIFTYRAELEKRKLGLTEAEECLENHDLNNGYHGHTSEIDGHNNVSPIRSNIETHSVNNQPIQSTDSSRILNSVQFANNL